LLEDVSNEEATQRSEATEQDRLARIDAAMGMFAHLPGSLDDFMKERQNDIKIEDRRCVGARDMTMNEEKLLERIVVNPSIFNGKPIIRGRRLAVEHVLGMLAAGDTPETILAGYPWLEQEDIQACLIYARRVVGRERVEPLLVESGK
jgi:uncharacterized protein (DUF433 family)